MAPPLRILMVAAECRDLAKCGGLADVVRDLSGALTMGRTGDPEVTVFLPYYHSISVNAEAERSLTVPFAGWRYPVRAFRTRLDRVRVVLLQNGTFFGDARHPHYGSIYVDSQKLGNGPFEDDAKRFAFFSRAVLEYLVAEPPDGTKTVLHCHDWHSGPLFCLLRHDPRYRELAARISTVFTIHNLEYQGERPFFWLFDDRMRSFAAWFPEVYATIEREGVLGDYAGRGRTMRLFNPMRAALRLADRVNTVSPSYLREILRPDDRSIPFFGGCGLEKDLAARHAEGCLTGILNGIDYERLVAAGPAHPPGRDERRSAFLENLPHAVATLLAPRPCPPAAYRPPAHELLVACVSRAVPQKLGMLFEHLAPRKTVLDAILERPILLIVLGAGELAVKLEKLNRSPNAVFINRFSADFSRDLFAAADLLLMPSWFEPCGISQLIAMASGCLPLVHDIGGLHDTVHDMQTGFVFGGADRAEKHTNLLAALDRALEAHREPRRWETMRENAAALRFDWKGPAAAYLELYQGGRD